jgi:hypothetical protein
MDRLIWLFQVCSAAFTLVMLLMRGQRRGWI